MFGRWPPAGSFRLSADLDAVVEKGARVRQAIVHVALVMRDYDEAIAFYTEKRLFTLVEDSY